GITSGAGPASGRRRSSLPECWGSSGFLALGAGASPRALVPSYRAVARYVGSCLLRWPGCPGVWCKTPGQSENFVGHRRVHKLQYGNEEGWSKKKNFFLGYV